MTTWKKLIEEHLSECSKQERVIFCTISEEELNREFDNDYGGGGGEPFTAWTTNLVLFPVVYDGFKWVDSVPRHPCEVSKEPVGGG